MPFIIAGGVVVVIVVITILALRQKKRSGYAGADAYRSLLGANAAAAPAKSTPEAEALRQNLRVKLLYQEDKIAAAIAFERERNPTASEEQLMKAAIERWERDNR